LTPAAPDRISVCICTFKRPVMLARLFERLDDQVDGSGFVFDVVVVDNDLSRSAEQTVANAKRNCRVSIIYDCEPRQNISLARNRAIRNATGNLIAFIDDDEAPVPDWLARLHFTLRECNADGVLGPVVPEFPPGAPRWLESLRSFQRRRLSTGTPIASEDARTGNLLIRRSIFVDENEWFDAAFGRTGGEDSDFFGRQSRQRRVFVWCDEAPVYETVPPERWRVSYHVKRYLRSGTLDGERMRAGSLPSRGLIVWNLALFFACAVITPFSLVLRRHITTRVLQKLAYCGGMITAFYGVSLLRYRD